jgi:Fe-S cluster biogenesis protein NfuA
MSTLSSAIDTLPTPNPNALMFKVGTDLVEEGTFEYPDQATARHSPLPRLLFGLDGVEQVLVTSQYVTVNKSDHYEWPDLVPAIKGLIREHMASGDVAVAPKGETKKSHDSELAQQISDLIDAQIRPAVAMDGGDIEFIRLTKENIVELRLIGACSSCPSATATLAIGIETLIVEEFPDVNGVEQVA